MAKVLTVYFSMKGQTIGLGIGDSVRDIKRICKGADVDSGASFTGSRVSGSEAEIAEWAKGRM